jgi:hypothetical protein
MISATMAATLKMLRPRHPKRLGLLMEKKLAREIGANAANSEQRCIGFGRRFD